jgi:alcohol dehydrogenase class IV
MQRASYIAGIAFSRAYVGYIHAVAHTLGGKYGISHGLANAVLMPIVLEQYGESVYKKLSELAVAAGIVEEGEDTETSAKLFIKALRDMNARLGIPEGISGIKIDDIPEMARLAEAEANPLYPVPVIFDGLALTEIYFKVMDKKDRPSIACS